MHCPIFLVSFLHSWIIKYVGLLYTWITTSWTELACFTYMHAGIGFNHKICILTKQTACSTKTTFSAQHYLHVRSLQQIQWLELWIYLWINWNDYYNRNNRTYGILTVNIFLSFQNSFNSQQTVKNIPCEH